MSRAKKLNSERQLYKTCLSLDKEPTQKAIEMFGELGITLSSAIRLFIIYSLEEGGFPFDVNDEAMRKYKAWL